MRPSTAFRFPALLALAAAALPSALAGQIENCEFLPGTLNWTSRTSGDATVTYVSRPRIRCNDGRYIEADSAVSFSASGYTELMGRVYFQDASQSLRAQRARYYDALRRLEADGEVVLTDRQSGNVMTGERLLYLREMPSRPREELTMTGGRPTATLHAGADTASAAPGAEAPDPYEVVADRLYLLGDALFRAFGDVEVQRDSLRAWADSMDYDREAGTIEFAHEARLQQGEMDLRGRHIRVELPGQEIQQIVATEDATLLGEEMDLEAYLIRLFFTDDALDRLVAVGERRALAPDSAGVDTATDAPPPRAPGLPSRATPEASDAEGDSLGASPLSGRAVGRAEGLVMSADSLDVLAPGEALEQVTAVGRARAVSTARDSLNTPETPELVRSDWIEGDTVVAFLRADDGPPGASPGDRLQADQPDQERAAPVGREGADAPARGERSYVLERLIASVNARSLYRMDPDEDTTAAAAPAGQDQAAADTLVVTGDSLRVTSDYRTLAVHYVEADRITIVFVDGAVDLMEVTGLRRGLHLEPRRAPRVSAAAPPSGGRP